MHEFHSFIEMIDTLTLFILLSGEVSGIWEEKCIEFSKFVPNACYLNLQTGTVIIVMHLAMGVVGPSNIILFGQFHACLTSFHTNSSLITFFVCVFGLFYSCCYYVHVFEKTLVHEFHISYSCYRVLVFS